MRGKGTASASDRAAVSVDTAKRTSTTAEKARSNGAAKTGRRSKGTKALASSAKTRLPRQAATPNDGEKMRSGKGAQRTCDRRRGGKSSARGVKKPVQQPQQTKTHTQRQLERLRVKQARLQEAVQTLEKRDAEERANLDKQRQRKDAKKVKKMAKDAKWLEKRLAQLRKLAEAGSPGERRWARRKILTYASRVKEAQAARDTLGSQGAAKVVTDRAATASTTASRGSTTGSWIRIPVYMDTADGAADSGNANRAAEGAADSAADRGTADRADDQVADRAAKDAADSADVRVADRGTASGVATRAVADQAAAGRVSTSGAVSSGMSTMNKQLRKQERMKLERALIKSMVRPMTSD